jgi:hypothetical protein
VALWIQIGLKLENFHWNYVHTQDVILSAFRFGANLHILANSLSSKCAQMTSSGKNHVWKYGHNDGIIIDTVSYHHGVLYAVSPEIFKPFIFKFFMNAVPNVDLKGAKMSNPMIYPLKFH